MRRLKVPNDRPAVFHVVTRVVQGRFLLGDVEREMLRRMLWQVADFSGVDLLTYCVLSNHFHALVRVPAKVEISDAELLRRCRVLYGDESRSWNITPGAGFSVASVEAAFAAGGSRADRVRAALQRRMGDVSAFMKTLKQRFAIWYNHTHESYGTLWAERFKSIVVENEPRALATVAAYIDLNPVRAGLVVDPKDYRWCGYGEAVGEGSRRIRDGLSSVLGHQDWELALCEYRVILFGKGSQAKPGGAEAAEISWEDTMEVLRQGGRLPAAAVLRCRVRYFIDGAALGSNGFVAEVLRRFQEATGRRLKQRGPCPLRGSAEWGDLATLRGVRSKIFTRDTGSRV